MNAAKDILRQKAPVGETWPTGTGRLAHRREVLSQDPVPQQILGQPARDVCTRTVTVFESVAEMRRARPTDPCEPWRTLAPGRGCRISIDQLRDRTCSVQLSGSARHEKQILAQQLRGGSGTWASAVSRWPKATCTVTRPISDFYTPAEIREAERSGVCLSHSRIPRQKLTDAELRDVCWRMSRRTRSRTAR